MSQRSAIIARSAALRARFEAAGATPVETLVLQPADMLLDLYGEDIRARAYTTSDATRGEQMLRPDFTVPIVQMHMAGGADPARYTYSGTVFRRQEQDDMRANEYEQVGYEVFDRSQPEDADAEVFSLIKLALGPAPLRAATGDIGILTAAVHGLEISNLRKAALLRHLWRPKRFRALLDTFAAPALARPIPEQAVLAPAIGLRRMSDVSARLAALDADAKEPALPQSTVDQLDRLLNIRATMPEALVQLQNLSQDMPTIATAVTKLATRMSALKARGVDVDTLVFETSYGRTSMEYYDGFVFGFYAEGAGDTPPVATGGRYDALTRQLGQGAEIPAVGGVIRPDLLMDLEGRS
jgi:ATP phosphoribosyltransferase regulatory subunit